MQQAHSLPPSSNPPGSAARRMIKDGILKDKEDSSPNVAGDRRRIAALLAEVFVELRHFHEAVSQVIINAMYSSYLIILVPIVLLFPII
jgi:hypothetical protein